MIAGTLMSGAWTSNGGTGVVPSKTRATPSQRATKRIRDGWQKTQTTTAAAGDLGCETNELEGVSQALFPVEQDRLASEMLTGPAGLREAETGGVAALESPFGLGPAALEVAVGEPAEGAVAMGLTEVRTEFDCLVVVSHRLRPKVLAGESHAEVIPDLGRVGPQGERGAKPRESIVELSEVREGDAEIHLGVERVGLDLERFAVVDGWHGRGGPDPRG